MIKEKIKTIVYYIVQIIRLSVINKRIDGEIYSIRASCNAKYGKKINIGKGTFVAYNVEIGDYSYINEVSWIENCTIGRYCSISDHVMINPSEHNLRLLLSYPLGDQMENQKVIIGNDVLISHGVTILSGVRIGNGAVIGAGAVVTNDIPPYEIWGGVPAKYIKKRFNSNTIKLIERTDLYKKNIEDAKRLVIEVGEQ